MPHPLSTMASPILANPSISAAIANGLSTPNNALAEAATDLPVWNLAQPLQSDPNQTDGTPFSSVHFSAISGGVLMRPCRSEVERVRYFVWKSWNIDSTRVVQVKRDHV